MPKITVAGLSAVCCLLITACVKDIGKLPPSVVNNGTGTSNGCDTVTYTKHIRPLLDNYCVSCHGTTPVAGAFPLMSYSDIKTYADNGQLKSTVFDAQPELMPQGGPPLPQDQKDLIMCWLSNGEKQ